MPPSAQSDTSSFSVRRGAMPCPADTPVDEILTPMAHLRRQEFKKPATWMGRVIAAIRTLLRKKPPAPASVETASETRRLAIDRRSPQQVHIGGHLTAATVAELMQTVDEIDEHPAAIYLHLQDLRAIDTASVAALVFMSRRVSAAGSALYVVGMNDSTREVMDLCDPRLPRLFEQGRIRSDKSITASHRLADAPGEQAHPA